jgi:hypothetical protein
MRYAYACNRCGKKIGDHNYTVHIIRHAFQDMEKSSLINMVKSKREYDEAEQRMERLAN